MEDNNILNPELIPGNVLDEDELHHINNPVAGLKPIVKKYLSKPFAAEQKNKHLYSSSLTAFPSS